MANEPLSNSEQLQVVSQMMEGDAEGLRHLLEAYGSRVKWLLRRGQLGDVLSSHDADTVLWLSGQKVFKRAASYDQRLGTLGGWFYTIAFHTAVDLVRRNVGRPTLPLDIDPVDEQREPACVAEDDNDLVVEDLLACVEKLGETQQRIAKADLLAGGEANASELARKLGIKIQDVYSYRNKYKKALLKRMKARGHTAESIRRQQ